MRTVERPWRHWHFSTIVVAALVGASIATLNLADSYTTWDEPRLTVERRFGWPFTYLARGDSPHSPLPERGALRPLGLILDLGCATLAILALGLGVEGLRRGFLFTGRSRVRGLLALLLVLSAGFGFARWQRDSQRAELEAVARLQALGIGVTWQRARPAWFWFLLPMVGGEPYRHAVVAAPWLNQIWAHSDEAQSVDNEVLAVASRLRRLARLDLPCHPTNGGPFVTPRITDQGLAHLRALRRLEDLDLSGQPITAKAVEHLKRLPRLKRLDLTGTQITPQGVNELKQAWPELTVLGP